MRDPLRKSVSRYGDLLFNQPVPMRRLLLRWALFLATAGFLPALPGGGLVAAELTVRSPAAPHQWTIDYAGQPVLVYSSHPQAYKPFVQDLFTTRGYGVLRDAPYDHLHHHALMYGIRVNGVNFWEETSGSGVQKVVESPAPEVFKTRDGLPGARLRQTIYWVEPQHAFLPNTNTPALLVEQRTLELVVDAAAEETALHWRSQFEPGSRTNQVILTGSNYHGLGMRFLQELDALAVHFTPEGEPDLSNNRQDVARHAWAAVSFARHGKPATIALFGAEKNRGGNPAFFAMRTPFAYLSATQGLDQEPLIYRRGDSFELNYLVVLYPQVKTRQAIAARAARWLQSGR